MRFVPLALSVLFAGPSLAAPAEDLAKARVEHTRVVLKEVRSALDLYLVQNGAYPSTENGLTILVKDGLLAREPGDAWGRPLVYERPHPSTCRLLSYGRDGKPGGTGEDADLIAD
jgi:general secretion pathway protein G